VYQAFILVRGTRIRALGFAPMQ